MLQSPFLLALWRIDCSRVTSLTGVMWSLLYLQWAAGKGNLCDFLKMYKNPSRKSESCNAHSDIMTKEMVSHFVYSSFCVDSRVAMWYWVCYYSWRYLAECEWFCMAYLFVMFVSPVYIAFWLVHIRIWRCTSLPHTFSRFHVNHTPHVSGYNRARLLMLQLFCKTYSQQPLKLHSLGHVLHWETSCLCTLSLQPQC